MKLILWLFHRCELRDLKEIKHLLRHKQELAITCSVYINARGKNTTVLKLAVGIA